MALFQNSVLRNYLDNVDKNLIENAFELYKKAFLPKIANIKASKEEQYQYGFLDDLFVKVLGYTLNPTPDYNLIAEQKNLSDSKKADGAILKDGKVVAVIELKSTKTKSMDKIVNQAFNYKHNHPTCKYIITSNFEKLRFYVEHSDKHEEFNLFELDLQRFTLMYLLLHKENILSDVPLTLKNQSKLQEENISNELYKKYATLRTNLFENITQNNPSMDKHILLEKTQTILDRMVFIFFGEDRGILPPNTIKAIVDHYEGDIEDRELWHFYKIYFNAINKGNAKLNIPEYNGGLFAVDTLLDALVIDNHVLDASPLMLSAYDFNSDIDVNILGHIFENSLNDIEELKARIEDEDFDVKQSKRKKDGVFYTPEYITKYIVDNTLGSLCQAKKEELGLDEVELLIPKNPKKLNKGETKQKEALDAYREYLLGLKILDPACGSGAFLNQALNYLLEEHAFIDESIKTLMGGSVLGLYDVKKGILENNLYGVDINAEAVEIAKLSLWLRTVESGRKLNKLADKIKVGNSLIDDKTVADDAFVWEEEFAEVFEQGGFDVVIGNPPYVDLKSLSKDINHYLSKRFKTANQRINLFSIFIEKSIDILNSTGSFSFIIPSALLTQESYKELRKLLLKDTQLTHIVRLPNESFGGSAGDVKVDTIILVCQKEEKEEKELEVLVYKGFNRINDIMPSGADSHFCVNQTDWTNDESYIFRINVNNSISLILKKCQKDTKKLVECSDFSLGLTPYDKYRGHTQEQIKNKVFHADSKKDETFKKLLAGNDIIRYNVAWNGIQWISYGDWLGASRESRFFTEKRILVKQIIDWSAKKIWAAIVDEELYNTQNAFNIISHDDYLSEYLIALINSKLMSFYHRKKFLEEYKDRFQKILIKDCKEFPIKTSSKDEQKLYVKKVNLMMSLNKSFQTKKDKFLSRISTNFDIEKLSKKIEAFYKLDFKTFLKELKKKKVTLTLKEQDEWEEYFESYQKELLEVKDQINTTDKQIDEMVYELYGLSEDEVTVVENI